MEPVRLAAGVDIGGTNTALGLVDRSGRIVVRGGVATGAFPRPAEFVAAVAEEIRRLMDCTKGATLVGAGIGCPNGNALSGAVEFAPNLPWRESVPLAALFREALGVEAAVANDANAAALGEMRFGAARGMSDFLFITLGTGLGSGIVSGGRVVLGHDGHAGELGHVIVCENGRLCGCGRQGCLEAYVSAGGLRATYRERGGVEATSEEIGRMAAEGEEAAREAFAITGNTLGLALANAVAVTSPEAIFLFGGLAKAGNLLLEPTRAGFESHALNVYRGNVAIQLSGLPEGDAAILGAASLAWERIAQ